MWVTSFFMEEALDEGAVILQKRFEAVKGNFRYFRATHRSRS